MDDPEDTRFLAIFATKRTLSLLSKSDILHVDATYRLNWNRYPVMIVGEKEKKEVANDLLSNPVVS